jgi:uroporphyrinogen-III synthase
LGEALRHWGAVVDEIAAYGTLERPRAEILASWQAAAADAVVVASPRPRMRCCTPWAQPACAGSSR